MTKCLPMVAFFLLSYSTNVGADTLVGIRVDGDSHGPIRQLRPFQTDGCSRSPDGLPLINKTLWLECCVRHDVSYWLGGTETDRLHADEALRACIADKGHPIIANIYFGFVHAFGGPQNKTTFRWGYGWDQIRPYSPLENWEVEQVEKLYGESLADVRARLSEVPKKLSNPGVFEKVGTGWSQDEANIYATLESTLPKGDEITAFYKDPLVQSQGERLYHVFTKTQPLGLRFFFATNSTIPQFIP